MDDEPAQSRPSTVDRKLRAKRFNEGLKLGATLRNSSAILTFAAVLINPLAQRRYEVLADGGSALILAATVLHLISQFVVRFLRSEE